MKAVLHTAALFFGLLLAAQAQQRTVSGTVTDMQDNVGLPGVNIRIKGTNQGAVTDFDGNYRLQAQATDTLLFSFVGYVPEAIAVGNRSQIDLAMSPDIETLSEVVVVGYGTTTKKELTGAVAQVNEEDIQMVNPTRIEQAMQGQMAGVNISTASGSPGGGANIRIRGISTNGNSAPLVIVDGVPYGVDGLAALNPNDIESIDVLKDASAAIYGVRAANGVIFITTKKGKKNSKPQVTIDGYYGIQETSKKLNLLNAREFAVLKNEAFAAGNQTPPYANTNLGEGTDWQDEVFQSAPIQNYNLGVSGGTEKSTYSFGGSYFDQEGIVGGEKSGYTRYNARLNFGTEIGSSIKFNNLFLYANENRKTLPENGIGSVLYNAINASPIDPVRNEDGRYTYLETISELINPLAQIENTFNDNQVNKLTGKQELNYEITDYLSATGRIGYNYAVVDFKGFNPLVYYGPGKPQNSADDEFLKPKEVAILGDTIPVPNNVVESRTTYFDYTAEAFINFEKEFQDIHKVKATLGTSLQQNSGESLTGIGYDVPFNSWEYADLSLVNGNNLQNNSSSYQFKSRLLSYFLRAEYGYDERYLVSALVRRDASTNFGPNNQWATFPSVAAAWNISEEDFFNFNTINQLKLRTSYGGIGNDRIDPLAARAILNGEGVYVFGDQLVNGTALGRLGNPDLRWEQSYMFNVGVDAGLWRNRLTLSAEYYVKTTKDLLISPEVSGVLGTAGAGSSAPFVNGGDIRNQGFELMASYRQELADDISFNVTYTLTTIKNEVISIYEGVNFIPGGAFGVGGVLAARMQPGYPFGGYFGYQTNGIYQSAEEIAASPVVQPGAQPGDLRFVDADGDGEIDFSGNTDYTYLGSPIPDATMGLNLGINVKGFDLSALLYASIGNELLRNYERQQPLANQLNYRIGRWTGPGSTTTDPRLTTGLTNNTVLSDYFVEDGSFLRAKTVQLGYTLPQNLTERFGMSRFRLYVSANNLFTLTDYRGYDPDFNGGDAIAGGIDYGVYPQARTIMGGFNINF